MLPLSMLLYVVCSCWIRKEATGHWTFGSKRATSSSCFLTSLHHIDGDTPSYNSSCVAGWFEIGKWRYRSARRVSHALSWAISQARMPQVCWSLILSSYTHPQRRILQALLCNILLFDKMSFACQMCFFVEVIASLVTSINSIYF